MRTATLLHYSDREGENRNEHVRLGAAGTYMLSEPATFQVWNEVAGEFVTRTTRYVWLSTSRVFGEWETYAFPAYRNGKVHQWGEMRGSAKHETNHDVVLAALGYEVAHSVSKRNTGKRK